MIMTTVIFNILTIVTVYIYLASCKFWIIVYHKYVLWYISSDLNVINTKSRYSATQYNFPFAFSSWWWLFYWWAETFGLLNFNLLQEDCCVWRYPPYLVDINFNFRRLCFLHIPEDSDFGGGGNIFLWNSCINISDSTASHRTRQYSTRLSLWRPQIPLIPCRLWEQSPYAGCFYSLHASHKFSPSRIPW